MSITRRRNDVNGFTIPFNEPDVIREKILKVLENPELARRFVEQSLEKSKMFDRTLIFEETENLFKQAAGKK